MGDRRSKSSGNGQLLCAADDFLALLLEGEVGQEENARLQRRDEDRLASLVFVGDLGPELENSRSNLLGGEIDLAELVGLYEARSSLYLSASRAMSRL